MTDYRKLPKHVSDVLEEAYSNLVEHNQDYHHMTPQKLLDKIKRILEENSNIEEKP